MDSSANWSAARLTGDAHLESARLLPRTPDSGDEIIERITRDEMLMRIASVVSFRGTCNRAQVGAVLARDGRIIATGYVGSPAGLPHCKDVGCDVSEFSGCIRTVHAEANAIAFAARFGIATGGSDLYCTHSPCGNCAKLIINAGVSRLVYEQEYRDKTPLAMLSLVGIETIQYGT